MDGIFYNIYRNRIFVFHVFRTVPFPFIKNLPNPYHARISPSLMPTRTRRLATRSIFRSKWGKEVMICCTKDFCE